MRLKNLLSLAENALNGTGMDNTPKADMFLSSRVLAISLVFATLGIGCGVGFVFTSHIGLVVACPLLLIFSLGAFLSWRNQRIYIIDEDTFVYSTFLGRKKVYHFSDITAIRRNGSSCTLFVGAGKVHIDSTVIMTNRLAAMINARFVQPEGEEE